MPRLLSSAIALAAFAGLGLAGAAATTVADAAGDFLPTYTGPQNGDLDVLSITATFDGSNFTLGSVENGAIGTTAGSLFVWGINRGAGTARLTAGTPSVGIGVLFDAVAVFRPDGSGSVTTFPDVGAATTTTLAAGSVTVTGNSITGVVPLALLPSRGFGATSYAFNLWPRSGSGSNTQISDFAPNASSIVANVPEPATWALMIGGFGMTGAAMRRRVRLAVV